MHMKAMRQPTYKPIMRPSGRPTIIAIAVPVTIMLIASALKGPLTSRTAIGEATDQKIE
jgi:hypothetical protein